MCPNKASGPHGLPVAFFQKHWQNVSSGVIFTCFYILAEQGDVTLLNHTPYLYCSYPKVAKPKKVTEFRLISLCNVMYRMVAKTKANKLKQILHQIISLTQSAVILIIDNTLFGINVSKKLRCNKSKKKKNWWL